ncbi:MAG TPA: BTAD domain-containing putative transcriptional regulator [Pseudonocardiaceae bacterium]|jgi:DNA-binding SARP family transcriptional activator|nr:BTAD domain-containing putative transcriptional regulator [Pseudonocardiaceae bacterium]
MSLQFRVLGPIEATVDGRPLPISSGRQRSLLAALLVDANRVVTARDLARRVWDDEIPASARETLHSYVARLRRTLGPWGSAVRTQADGYLIEVAAGALDLDRFTAGVRAARVADNDDPTAVSGLLGAALAEWRGDALADVRSGALRREFVPALHEQRLAATELRLDAELRLGRYQDVIAELAELTAKHPLREQLWAHRMLALYRAGRQAEALACYQAVRVLLADELGIDPGHQLQRLHQAILTDGAGIRPLAEHGTAAAVRLPRNDLPGDVPDFAGRAEDLKRLFEVAPTHAGTAVVIAAIDGMAGVGKTTLAVHVAHQLAEHYPDGQLFLDLRGHTPQHEPIEPAAALSTLLRALGVPADRIPADLAERAALWRAELADRRALLVLDNASSTNQVRPLLPGSPTCVVLITSRRRLADLDTTETLSLDVLAEPDALALFTSVVGAKRVGAEPDATSDVLRLCGYLPLAIRIAAARLRTRPAWPVRALAERLGDETRDSDELAIGDRSVTAAIALSHHRLDGRQQHLFALLGQHPGISFDRYQAAALGGIGVAAAEQLLDELLDVHLLQEPSPGRYRCHDLVRHYARTRTTAAESITRDAVTRLLDQYRHLARRLDAHLNPNTRFVPAELGAPGPAPAITDADSAIRWCETELANLMAAVDHAAAHGWRTHAWQLASALHWFFKRHGHTDLWIRCLTVGVAATETDTDRADLLRQLGEAHYIGGDDPRCLLLSTEALTLYRRTGDTWGEGAALINIGNIHFQAGDFIKAIDHYREAIAVREAAGSLRGIGTPLTSICYAYQKLGRFTQSLEYGRRALDVFRQTGDRRGEGMVLNNIAELYLKVARDPQQTLNHGHQALAIDREVHDRRNEACALDTVGMGYRLLGDLDTALDYLHRSLALAMDIGNCVFEENIRANVLDTYLLATKADSLGRVLRPIHEADR